MIATEDRLLEDLTWSDEALGDALLALARAKGHAPLPVPSARSLRGEAASDPRARDAFVESLAHAAGIEAEAVEATYAELDDVLVALGPALVCVPTAHGPRVLAVLSARRGQLVVLGPSLERARVPASLVARALLAPLEEQPARRVDAWLAVARVAPHKLAQARRQLLAEVLGERTVSRMWLLRADPGSSFVEELARQGVLRRAALFVLTSLAQLVVSLVGWTVIGKSSLAGVVDHGWLVFWVMVTLTAIPLQIAALRLGGRLGLDLAAALKQRLLTGALRLDPDSIRAEGSGRLLAMVSESNAIENAGLGGAFGAVIALLQLAVSAVVLALGAAGLVHVILLAAWCAVIGAVVVRSYRRRATWTAERFALTHSFVENVVGNRTRITQQSASAWHGAEDELLARYVTSSRDLDASSTQLAALPSRGWLLLGLLGLVPAVLAQHDVARLAVSIGGILQAEAAFGALVASASALLGAHVAWRSIGRLFRAAAQVPRAGIPEADGTRTARRASLEAGAPVTVLEASGVSFRYRPTGEPVLRDCALTVRDGDRVLVEGRSGGGKSTLASLLTGQRTPEAGHILLRGLDAGALGARGWQRRVASAPQFHENHILSATLAFNLLMGRGWPATDADRREAESVCRELGLGPLLDRMPSGLDQMVGETGWQLSHGERSRVFLARALLQRADLVVLDESFGALDPLTLETCVETALARAPALVVIAHP